MIKLINKSLSAFQRRSQLADDTKLRVISYSVASIRMYWRFLSLLCLFYSNQVSGECTSEKPGNDYSAKVEDKQPPIVGGFAPAKINKNIVKFAMKELMGGKCKKSLVRIKNFQHQVNL